MTCSSCTVSFYNGYKEAFFKRNTKYVELKAGVTFDPRKTSVIARSILTHHASRLIRHTVLDFAVLLVRDEAAGAVRFGQVAPGFQGLGFRGM